MTNGCFIDEYGNKRWYQNYKRHRDNDEPAVILSNGTKKWYQNGLLHRDNDEPAVIDSNGTKRWYQNGLLHRDNDEPAIICSNGDKFWFQNDKQHRDNGAAIEYFDGTKRWCIVGKEYSEEEYWRRIKLLVFR